MINVFGYRHEKGAKISNDKFDGAVFIDRTISGETLKMQESVDERKAQINKRSSLPLLLTVMKFLTLFAGMIIIVSILKARVSLSEALQNAPWLFIVGIASLIIYAILELLERTKKKQTENSIDFADFTDELNEMIKASLSELGIPENAPTIDVFMFNYKLNKKNVPVQANSDSKYIVTDLFIFQDDKTVYLADLTSVFAFPKSDFVKIEKISKRTTFKGWTKEDAFNSEKYKKFKMTANQYGTIFCKTHYSLQISKDGKIFEILIPPYEVATFAKLLNLQYDE